MDNKYALFLDAKRFPGDARVETGNPDYSRAWIVVKSYSQFINAVKSRGLPELVSFDHDISDKRTWFTTKYPDAELTGHDCAKWLIEYCIINRRRFPDFLVHCRDDDEAMELNFLLNGYKTNEDAYIQSSDMCYC